MKIFLIEYPVFLLQFLSLPPFYVSFHLQAHSTVILSSVPSRNLLDNFFLSCHYDLTIFYISYSYVSKKPYPKIEEAFLMKKKNHGK